VSQKLDREFQIENPAMHAKRWNNDGLVLPTLLPSSVYSSRLLQQKRSFRYYITRVDQATNDEPFSIRADRLDFETLDKPQSFDRFVRRPHRDVVC
jgi:hypothetical protein